MKQEPLTERMRDTLALFEESGKPWTTPEVAERLDLGRRTAYARLERLVEQGRIETKSVGASARVWWRPQTPAEKSGDRDTETVQSGQDIPWKQQFRSLVEATEEYAILMLDPDGYVQTWNPGAARIKGYDAGEILNKHFSTFYTEDDRAKGIPEKNLEAAADTGSIQEEGWRLREDGSRFWANVTITAIRSDDGELIGYAKVTRDMTDRKRMEAERELQYETTRNIAEAETIGDGLEAALQDVYELTDWEYAEVWIPTDDGVIRRTDLDYYEDEFTEFAVFSEGYTFSRDEGLPGRVWATGEFEWAADLPSGSFEAYPRRERAIDANLKSALGVPVVADDEVVAVLTFLMSETRDTDERLVEIVSSVAANLGNLVVRRQVEEEMKHERDLIDQILAVSPIGIQVLDLDGEITRMNDRAREILEIPDDQAESYTPAERTTYNADGERVSSDDHPFSRVLATGEAMFDWQARVELPDGGHRWLTINAAPVLDAEGEVERVITTGEDITQLKEQTRRLERQREDLKQELDEMFERISDGFYALDNEFRIEYINEHAEALVGLKESSVIGQDIREVVGLTDQFEAALHRALEEQTPVRIEDYFELLDAWFENTIYPSESGVSVHFKDITKRKDRERELEQYETILESVNEGVYVLDANRDFQWVNESYAEMLGYSREELIGENAAMVVDDEALQEVDAIADEQGYENVPMIDAELVTATGERVSVAAATTVLPGGEEDGWFRAGIVRDITERKERQRELQRKERRFQTIIENFPNGAVALVDDDLRYTTFGGTPVGETDLTREDFEGSLLRDVLPPELADVVIPRYEEALDGSPSRFVDTVDDRVYQSHFLPVHDEDGDIFLAMAISQDITERKAREQELRDRIRQQKVVTDLGTRALEDLNLDTLMVEAARLVAETLDNDYCKVLELDTDTEHLLLRQGVGWDDEIVSEATVSAVEDDSQASYTLATEKPVIVEDLPTESRFSGPDLLRNHDVRSGISTIIGPADDPWGILGTHDTDRKEFSEQDATFVQSVANVLAAAINRHHYEQELVHQREQLEALNSLNEVLRGITSTIIEQSTREEIETVVCERLAESDSYLFAWTGDVDTASQKVALQTEAGVEGYLDGITISVNSDDERSDGPTATAFRTGTVQVVNDIHADSQHDPWRENIEEHGFRSSAAIPIVHEETVYGVLNIYAERPDAFTGQERNMVAQLGEIVGHAIAAAERKQALLSDELVELDFQIQDVFAGRDAPGGLTGTVTLDHTVAVGDGEYLIYGTGAPDALDNLTSLVETQPHWESVTVRSEGDPSRFELRVTDPPILPVVASHGGYLDQAVIEDGNLRMTIHLAPTVDVREVINAVEEAYPTIEMVRRQQISRERDDLHPFQRRLMMELTDRQRAALEAAYHAGFFEWPRDTPGEEVADSMGIASPTFHQHLRKAERKVFDAIFSSPIESAG